MVPILVYNFCLLCVVKDNFCCGCLYHTIHQYDDVCHTFIADNYLSSLDARWIKIVTYNY